MTTVGFGKFIGHGVYIVRRDDSKLNILDGQYAGVSLDS